MAMRILESKLFTFNLQKGAIAMSRTKVEKRNAQVKLVFGDVPEPGFSLDRLLEELGLEFHAFATSAGVLVMKKIMEAEEELLAGKRQSHGTEINRHGTNPGSVMLGGQKVHLDRRRLRTRDGQEVRLESYERFTSNGERARAVYESRLAGLHGLSCRSYRQTVEAVAEGYGVSKSVVNRELVEATTKDLETLCERDLSELDIWVLVIDGVKVGSTTQIVALGVDFTGEKHFLGFREGSTENGRVCLDLLHDLVKRNLKIDHPLIVVIDGSPALRSAVDKFFGERAHVQRCPKHKRQNVKTYLPDQYHAEYDRKIQAAWAMTDYEDAKNALRAVVRELQRINLPAAESLEEGFEETLTLHRLSIPSVLRMSFRTTNLIESSFSRVRTVMRNVKRWRTGTNQTQRWTATALLEAEKRFRKVKGYKSMSVLRSNLEIAATKKQSQQQQAA
jgi:transposase-like protein